MRVTIDMAGRLVIPKPLRDEVGITSGEVEVTIDGAALKIEAPAGDDLEERDGRLIIPGGGAVVDDALVEALRDAGRR
jgi:AbrB family looped-hinge helix DNA binding protein